MRSPSPVLFLCLFASQAAMLVLSPILPEVAREFGVSTATAGQLRSISGADRGATAVLLAVAPRRPGLRDLLAPAPRWSRSASVLSAAAPSFAVLAGAQARRSGSASACWSPSGSPPPASGRRRGGARTCSPGRSPGCRRPGSPACRSSGAVADARLARGLARRARARRARRARARAAAPARRADRGAPATPRRPGGARTSRASPPASCWPTRPGRAC